MKKQLITLLLISIFISPVLLAQPVRAQTTDWEWGVQVGDEVAYILQRKVIESQTLTLLPEWLRFIDVVDESNRFDLVVEGFEEIPANPTLTDPIPTINATVTRHNDSVLLYNNKETGFFVPVGDWDFHTERMDFELYPQLTLINSDTEWGYIEDSRFPVENGYVNYHGEIRYDKETGAINFLRVRYDVGGEVILDVAVAEWYEGILTTLPPDVDITYILTIAIAVSIGIIVAICVYKSYTGKKPLVQRLGE